MVRAGRTPMFMLIFAVLMLAVAAVCGVAGIRSVLDANETELVGASREISTAAMELSDTSFELFMYGDNLTDEQSERIISLLDNSKQRLESMAGLVYDSTQFANELKQTVEFLNVYRDKLGAVTPLLPDADAETRKKLLEEEIAPLYNELSGRIKMLIDFNTSIQDSNSARAAAAGNYNTMMMIVAACLTMLCMCPMLIVAVKGVFSSDDAEDQGYAASTKISELAQLEERIKRLEEKK